MKTPHQLALELHRLATTTMMHDDGNVRPCLGGMLNPQWVAARVANLVQAIVGNYDVREAISDEPPPVRTPVDWNDPRIK